MRAGVTIEDVTWASDELLAKGERPTVEGVRTLLGTGSPGTVNALLKDYYKALPSRLNLPAPIAVAAAELYKKVRDAAEEDADKREEERQAAVDQERQRLASDRSLLEAERTQLRDQVTVMSTYLATSRERAGALEQQLSFVQGELSRSLRETSAAEARAQAAIDERERQTKKHAEEVTQLRERADGNERHLLGQIEDLRTQQKRLLTEREKDATASAKRVSELESGVARAAADAVELRKELTTTREVFACEQQAKAVAEAALVSSKDAHARELAEARRQIEVVIQERDSARTAIERAQRDHQQALSEGAALRGRCEALAEQLAGAQAELKKPRRAQRELDLTEPDAGRD